MKIAAVLSAALLVGCGARTLPPSLAPIGALPPIQLATVVAAYEQLCTQRRTVRVAGEVEVRDLRVRKARRLSARLVAARGGRLYIKGSVAVVTAIEVVANAERFWFQVPSRRTVWTGRSNAATPVDAHDDDAPYQALRPSDLLTAFLPEPIHSSDGLDIRLDRDRLTVTLVAVDIKGPEPVLRRRVTFQRTTLLPMRTDYFNEAGEIELAVAWERGLSSRTGLLISRPIQGYEAEFSIDKWEENVDVPERAFTPRIPEGYKTVEVTGP